MLVLTRREGEQLVIGDQVIVTVLRVRGDRVCLGIDAPESVLIVRSELLPKDVTTCNHTPGGRLLRDKSRHKHAS